MPFFLHKKKKQPTFPVLTTLAEVLQAAKQSSDFVEQVEASKDGEPIHVYYYQYLIDMERIAESKTCKLIKFPIHRRFYKCFKTITSYIAS